VLIFQFTIEEDQSLYEVLWEDS